MPEKFKQFIASLTDQEADELFLYLDGSSNDLETLDYIAETHPNLFPEESNDGPQPYVPVKNHAKKA